MIMEQLEQLMTAVVKNNLSEVKELATKTAVNVHTDTGDTPLMSAIRNELLEVVQILLENGANPNFGNSNGWYPLHFAVQQRQFDIVQLLLEKGAQVNQKDGQFGNTPLFIAIMKVSNPEDFVRILIENGADAEVENNMGVSPKKVAIRKGIKIV